MTLNSTVENTPRQPGLDGGLRIVFIHATLYWLAEVFARIVAYRQQATRDEPVYTEMPRDVLHSVYVHLQTAQSLLLLGAAIGSMIVVREAWRSKSQILATVSVILGGKLAFDAVRGLRNVISFTPMGAANLEAHRFWPRDPLVVMVAMLAINLLILDDAEPRRMRRPPAIALAVVFLFAFVRREFGGSLFSSGSPAEAWVAIIFALLTAILIPRAVRALDSQITEISPEIMGKSKRDLKGLRAFGWSLIVRLLVAAAITQALRMEFVSRGDLRRLAWCALVGSVLTDLWAISGLTRMTSIAGRGYSRRSAGYALGMLWCLLAGDLLTFSDLLGSWGHYAPFYFAASQWFLVLVMVFFARTIEHASRDRGDTSLAKRARWAARAFTIAALMGALARMTRTLQPFRDSIAPFALLVGAVAGFVGVVAVTMTFRGARKMLSIEPRSDVTT